MENHSIRTTTLITLLVPCSCLYI